MRQNMPPGMAIQIRKRERAMSAPPPASASACLAFPHRPLCPPGSLRSFALGSAPKRGNLSARWTVTSVPDAPPMSAPQPAIECIRLSKQYGEGAAVLAGLDLRVGSGEFVSVVGPSGCGKTTLLRLLAGLTKPSSGEVRVFGHPVQSPPPDLAFVFQDPALLPWLTVERNIRLPLRLRGLEVAEEQQCAHQALEMVGLREVAGLHPRQLSGGMRMRVSLARALALRPRLLLLDEPFGALDAISRNRLNQELLRLRAACAWTAVFVTHSVQEAAFLSTRILVLGPVGGELRADVPVPFPYPRSADLRHSADFNRICADIHRHHAET